MRSILDSFFDEVYSEDTLNTKDDGHSKDSLVCGWTPVDGGYRMVKSISGVNENDIVVEYIEKKHIPSIRVFGQTEQEDKTYNVELCFLVPNIIREQVLKSVKYKTKDGLIYVYLDVEEKEKNPPMKVERI